MGKVILTAFSLCAGVSIALYLLGGAAGLYAHFDPYPWFSLFGRGINTDLDAAFSMLVGVLSSQIYYQAVFSSRNLSSAQEGL